MKTFVVFICLFSSILISNTAWAGGSSREAQRARESGDPSAGGGGGGGGWGGTIRSNQNLPGEAEPDRSSTPRRVRQDQRCEVTCGGGKAMTVDLVNRCMCIPGKCFLIDIGYRGVGMTTTGTGTLAADVRGAKYQTSAGPGNTRYDNDAIRMGIYGNDRYGKWIHKTRNCNSGGGMDTAGCIAVPCQYWPEVKSMAGDSLQVCKGTPSSTTTMRKGKSSGTE